MDKDERIWRFRLDKFGGQMSSPPSKICMNELCGASTTPQWKRGWPMKAGGSATLCYSCGTAYDNVNYCERFHLNEPGWRECKMCDKPIHCGCVVSKYLYQCLDLGGISCMKCLRPSATQPLRPIQSYTGIPNGFAPFSSIGNWPPSLMDKRINGGSSFALEKHKRSPLTSSVANQIKQDENRISSREYGTVSPNKSSLFAIPLNIIGPNSGPKTNSAGTTITNGIFEGEKQEKVTSFKQGEKSRYKYIKPSKSGVSINKGTVSVNGVARRPAKGRGGTQLLPRYWPKMTEQELLQISGDLNSNCTITPLFEKVLSASDAGRIGRLVLPKACAEAYFPPINQSDGLPIRIRDIKGKEWTFQFRFWPNNNSRMYVLEGVTPCIQSMQLQAGDTVIFSRLDPEDKLVIGCRKATVDADTKESEPSALPNGGTSCGTENQPIHEGAANGNKTKARNIGLKSKRLLMHSEDAIELKVTWEEAQEFLCPPSTSKPTVVTIEDCEIEEYDEPPVFSKNSTGCSCSASDEINTADLERNVMFGKESKKQKITERIMIKAEEHEPSGLFALATAAVLGENVAEHGQCSVNTTTRHPRHRPGCTCIVCIQPPSGKGKHKPTCICNVCSTVKRRFKTLMMRRKKRLLETVPVKGEIGGPQQQPLDLNCDPPVKEEEWRNVLGGLVPCSVSKGTSGFEPGRPNHIDEGCPGMGPSPGRIDDAVKLDNGVVEGR